MPILRIDKTIMTLFINAIQKYHYLEENLIDVIHD